MGVVGQKCRTSGYHWKCVREFATVGHEEVSYLVKHVFQRVRTVNRKAYKE